MVWTKRNRIASDVSDVTGVNERLDRLGSEVIRASSMDEAETEAIVSAPFLYSRLRARIAAETTRGEEKDRGLSIFRVFWRTVPAMALLAVFCLVLFLSSNSGGLSTAGFSEDGVPNSPGSEIERVVFAERQPLSNDEVLATILGREDGEDIR